MRQLFAFIFFIFVLVGCDTDSSPTQQQQLLEGTVQAGALSADGQWSLLAAGDGSVMVWRNPRQELVYQWQLPGGEQHPIYLLAISADSQYAVTASDKRFAVWSLKTGQSLGFYQIAKDQLRAIAIASGGQQVVYGRRDGVAVYVNLQTGRRLEFLGHQEQLNAVAIAPNGHYALTGGNDHRAYLWNTQTGQIVYPFRHSGRVTQVALDQQGQRAFTADSMDEAVIWDLTTGKVHSRLHFSARQRIFSAARFSTDNSLLITGAPSRRIELWDTRDGKRLQSWQANTLAGLLSNSAVVYDVAFKGSDILSISSAGLLEQWTTAGEP